MNFTKKLIFTLSILSASFASVSTMALAAAQERTQLESFIRDGIASSVSIKAQKVSLEQSVLSRKNYLANLLPSLSLTAGRTMTTSESISSGIKSETTSTSNTAEISGSWTLWDNFSSLRNLRVAEISENIEKIKQEKEVEYYILNLLDNYFEYLLSLRRREVLEQSLVQTKLTHDESVALVKAGARTQIEALDTEIQVLNTERDLLELNQNIKSSKRNLLVLLNKEENYQIPILDMLTLEPYFMKKFESALGELKRRQVGDVVYQSKEYQIAKLGLESTSQKLRQTELGYWPSTSVKLSHSFNLDNIVAEEPSGGLRTPLSSTTLGLSLSWQFFDWWSTPRSIQSSQLDFHVAGLRFQEETQTSKAKYEGVLESFEINQKSLEASKKALLKAQKQQEFAREMYRLGRINLLSMQQSTSRLFDAEISYASRKKSLIILAAQLLYYHGTSLVPQ